GATITGIRVNVERSSNNNGTQRDNSMRLVKAGTVTGADRATSTIYSTTDTYESHGGATDLWGTTWTPADINQANFGAALSVRKQGTSGGNREVYVDHMQISVDYSLPCAPPPNAPSNITLTCVCDNFGRTSLNPSTIFGANWTLSNSDGIGNPDINQTTGLLRLTESTGYNAKAATVPSIFPAAGNYISVEFNHYAYDGSNPGADGIAVTLSDYSVPAVPGAFGGSLGYAQRNDSGNPPGFAGGWVGVAIDEYGNYQNPTEGRVLGSGFIPQSVGVRGPGRGSSGYRWLGGTGSNPGGQSIDNFASNIPAPGHMYQVIVDARPFASSQINVIVNRDTTTRDGSSYSTLFGPFNAYPEASHAVTQGWISKVVPDYWKISFTGSTGGSFNIHEIGGLRICAQTVVPPTGGIASGFSAIDESYPTAPNSTVPAYQNFQTGNIFMKLVGTPFKLWVAALTSSSISTAYSAASSRHVAVKLVDNSDGTCGTDAARTCNAACTGKAAVEGGATQIVSYGTSDPGAKLSPQFTLNSAWKNLIAVVRECTNSSCTAFTPTAPACSADAFSVRPLNVSSVTFAKTQTPTTPLVMKAGSDTFTMTATTAGVTGVQSRYTGTLKVNDKALQALPAAGDPGTLSQTSLMPSVSNVGFSRAERTDFTYSEVGTFTLPPYSIYDGVIGTVDCIAMTPAQCDTAKQLTWTAVDSVSTKGDCIADSFSNTLFNGRYGCNFGNGSPSPEVGRFVPDHFAVLDAETEFINRSDINGGNGCSPQSAFTYMGEPLKVRFKLQAQNAANLPTKKYIGSYATLNTTNWLDFDTSNSLGFWMTASGVPVGAGTCRAVFSNTSPYATSFSCTGVSPVPSTINRTSGSRVTVVPTPAAPNWQNGEAIFESNVILERADAADGPYTALKIGIAPKDADGIGLAQTALNLDADATSGNERHLLGERNLRYGRLFIPNTYGSELLDLPVNVRAEYWNGTTYVPSADDNCTSIAAANFTVAQDVGAAVNTSIVGTTGTLVEGKGVLNLSKPTNILSGKGSVRVSTSNTAPVAGPLNSYLPGSGVQTFGVSKKDGDVIYLRELHF
uniref:DUF6701 domain-containing protein n=1 Tax=Noviherbaspirillum sp. TaxID=1926288 RepID=UPI002FE0B67D